VTYQIRFYGHAERLNDGTGRATWGGGQEVLAVAYDVMIPGFGKSLSPPPSVPSHLPYLANLTMVETDSYEDDE
jgi:Carbohydrate phosphorylase